MARARTIRVLIADNDSDDRLLIADLLSSGQRGRYELTMAGSYAEGLAAMLTGVFDICLLDYELDGHIGLDIIRSPACANLDAPIVVLSGHGEYEVDLAFMLERPAGDQHAFAVMYFDLDGFKSINDRLGHGIDGDAIFVTTSIGIALCPPDGADVSTLINNADAAMYLAKQGGRDTCHWFNAQTDGRPSTTIGLENELHAAIENNELYLVYQPQFDRGSGRIIGLEALTRWALTTACDQYLSWRDAGLVDEFLVLNRCAFEQGFYYAPGLPVADCTRLLRSSLPGHVRCH